MTGPVVRLNGYSITIGARSTSASAFVVTSRDTRTRSRLRRKRVALRISAAASPAFTAIEWNTQPWVTNTSPARR